MPIYAYQCSACGFTKDVLQKFSDAPLTVCPSCGQSSFGKQLTAPAFQLKGTGWYVTDFRDNGKKPAGEGAGASSSKAASTDTGAQAGKSADTSSAASGAAPSPAAAPASSGSAGKAD